MDKKYIFFRNDDVGGKLDDSLIVLTNVFIREKVPICHAVEPANLSKVVIEWLFEEKQKHPEKIEIVQHGYSHKINYSIKKNNGNLKKGEFGGERTYNEQLYEILEGKKLLDSYFGNKWFPLFTFPFGSRNDAAINAVNDAGFKVVNGSISFNYKSLLFQYLARLLKKRIFLNKPVSWNLQKIPGLNLFQINVCVNFIKKYHEYDNKVDFYTLDDLKLKTNYALKKTNCIGIVLHHRFHESEEAIKLVEDYIKWLKGLSNIFFVTQSEIFNELNTDLQ